MEDKLTVFQEWLAKNGARWPKLELRRFDAYDGGWGAEVKEEILPGEPVVSVPLELLVTFEDMRTAFRESPSLSKLLAVADAEVKGERGREQTGGSGTSAEWVLFYAFMLLEIARGEGSRWHAYWSILPEDIPSAAAYDEDCLQLLRGTNLLSAVHYIRESLGFHLSSFRHALEGDDGADAIRFSQVCDEQRVLWAYRAFWSRAYVVQKEGKEMPAMVPLADMLNHRSAAKVKYVTDDSSSCFTLRSESGAPAGGEFFSNYGIRSSEKLLLNYGFFEDDNPQDAYLLIIKPPEFNPEENDPALQAMIHRKQQLLSSSSIGLVHYISKTICSIEKCFPSSSSSSSSSSSFSSSIDSSSSSPIPETLLEALRVLTADHLTLYEWEMHTSAERGAAFPRTEMLALLLLKDFLAARLGRFDSPDPASDEALLLDAATGLSATQRDCIRYRRVQKQILLAAMRWTVASIDSFSVALFQPPYDRLTMAPESCADREYAAALRPRLARFEAWARAHGMASAANIAIAPDGSLQLLAASDVPAGEPALRIPAELMISMETAARTPHRQLINGVARLLDVEDALFLMLMLERASTKRAPAKKQRVHGKASRSSSNSSNSGRSSSSSGSNPGFWEPFFDALPLSISEGTVNFDAREMEALAGTALQAQSVNVLACLREDYENLVGALRSLKAFDSSVHTWRLYLWARCVFETRCVHLENGPHVLPLAVLPSHHPHALLEKLGDGESGGCYFVSPCVALRQGDVICDYYGGLDNAHLLLYHGRCLHANPYDFFPLSLSVLPDDPEYLAKNQALATSGCTEHPLRISVATIPPILLHSLQIIQPGLSPSEHTAALHDMLLRIRASLTSKPSPTNLPKRLQHAQQYSQDQLKIIDLFITLSRS